MGHSCSHTTIEAKTWISGRKINAILKKFFTGKVKKGEISEDLYKLTSETYESAIDVSFEKPKDAEKEFVDELKTNVRTIAAFKNHQQSKEIHALLVDDEGNTRSFAAFKKEALKVSDEYNGNWLNAEYNLAVRSARQGKRWKAFEADADLYPNLKYIESSAAEPRDEHRKFYGVVKPINDKFWDRYYPPSLWGCQCDVEQTRDDVTALTDTELASFEAAADNNKGLAGNVGKEGRIWTIKHPYVTNTSKAEKKKVQKFLKDYYAD